MDLRTRLEVQGAAQQWADSFMARYQVPASVMEDALTKVLLEMKNRTMVEFLSMMQQESLAQQEVSDDAATEASD